MTKQEFADILFAGALNQLPTVRDGRKSEIKTEARSDKKNATVKGARRATDARDMAQLLRRASRAAGESRSERHAPHRVPTPTS